MRLNKKCCFVLMLCVVMLSMSGCQNNTENISTNDEAVISTTNESTQPEQETPSKELSATVLVETEPVTEVPTDYVFRWERSNPNDCYDSTGFVSVSDVIPDAVLDIRYYSSNNFVGERINGYEEPLALLSEETAYALKNAADELRNQGYRIKIFDAYRPQRAVEHFASWASDWNDTKMKDDFYPSVDKSLLFDYGYIAYYSGHSRGSKVDMTLVDSNTDQELDMGGTFDYFDVVSHPDYTGITSEQYNNRMILQQAMLNNGFYSCSTEWWDFTLSNEPYPYTYFDFPVKTSSLTYKSSQLKNLYLQF